jgi:hypothetical protein
MLRSGFAARFKGSLYLLFRVHLLPRMRLEETWFRVRQLWRRVGAAADSSGSKAPAKPSLERQGSQVKTLRARGVIIKAISL